MSSKMNILLFGDQGGNYHLNLRDKLHQKNNPILTSFFEKTNVALCEEVARQPGLVRDAMPQFSSLLDLLESLDDPEASNPAIESAICCISQISCLICYLHFTSDSIGYIDPSSTRILGSCTGLLAGVAASSSRGLSDLPDIGVTLVRVAFRIGLLVATVGNSLQQGYPSQESWSTVITGVNEKAMRDILGKSHTSNTTSLSKQAYISATTSHSLTVSGPPSTRQPFVDAMSALSGVKQIRLPVHGPYHAGHLYSPKRLEEMLEPFNEILTSYAPRVPLISAFTGCPIPGSTAFQLVETAVEEILRKTLKWDRVIEGAVSEVRKMKVVECSVLPAGPADIGGLMSALKNCSNCTASLDQSLWNTPAKTKISTPKSGKLADSKIAIVGMAGRFPNAANHELFWELLERGTDTHKVIPKDRFDEAHIDPTGHRKNTSYTPYGCFIDEPGLFDPRFFRMSPREATQTDPMHRLAILTAYEALEMSGYVPNRTPSTMLHRVGTFYGQTSDDWREIQEGQNIDTYFIPGGVRAFATGRINYFFKFSGPSFSVDTACSSSFAALQLAVTSLRTGACDTAITGGMNVMTNSDIFAGLSRGQFLSKTGNCQTFDNNADGYCRGEAVGSVVLKRLEDAEADKDNILGVILESMTNHSADAISITHPHAPTQEYLYKQLLSKAAMDANNVSYIEMHGTGTQAGDGTEMESVTNVFASPAPSHRRRLEQPLRLGAVKANIGHGEAASGVCALIKVLMMMEKNAIPPNCGIKGVINQGFPKDLDARNVHIPLHKTAWPRPNDQTRKVFISNFSAAGGNTGVLMEDAPLSAAPETQDPRSTQIVTVSGKSKSSLRNNLQQLINYISNNVTVELPSLSYTTTARRMHYNYRVAVAESELSKVKASLALSVDADIPPISPIAPQVAFVFTGQGSHYAALGKRLFEESSQFRSDILQFDDMAQAQGLPSFLGLIDGTLLDVSRLSPTIVQLGSTCVQMALARLWMSWGVVPGVVLGHSLGEYAALNIAGVLSASDCIYLVGKRAHELESKCAPGTHAMLAVAASMSSVEPFMKDYPVEVACINSSSETVLGGPSGEIDKLAEELSHKGIKNTKLQIPFAFHVSQVDPILDSYEKIADDVTFNAPSVPVISPLLGEVIRGAGSFNPTYVRRHARETVNFPVGLEAGFRDGVVTEKTIWVEIGPHPICSAMVKKILGPTVSTVPSLRRNDDPWKVISTGLASLYTSGLNIKWNEYQRDFNTAQQLLRLPTYNFDLKNYWIDYVGNWNLTKGDIGVSANIPPPKLKLATTSVHKIVEESIQDDEAMVIVETDISEPTLRAAIKGHQMNGNGLCPSSLYADMALTIAEYLHKKIKPDAPMPAMNVGNMAVDKPLIAGLDSEQQLLRVRGVADVKTGQVNVQYYSVTSAGEKKTDHAKCIVDYVDAEKMLLNWQRLRYLIQPRIDALLNGVYHGSVEKIRRDMAYALFGSFVTYSDNYRGMEEVALNTNEYEATAKVAFQTKDEDGQFTCSPYWIDSIGHLSGFVVNVKEALGSKAQVFISHGWESMCFARPLSKEKTYRSYVKMQSAGGKVMAGDVVLFEGDEIIGVIGGLKFQAIPRSLLNTFLPPAGASNRKGVTPAAPPKQTAVKQTVQIKAERKEPSVQYAAPPERLGPDLASRALNVVAEEIGVPTSELSGNVVFEDMGVDSLMSLTITARLREELEMDISQTLFVDCPTVAEFLLYFPVSEVAKRVDLQSSSTIISAKIASSNSSSSTSIDQLRYSSTPIAKDDYLDTPASSNDDEDMVETIRAAIAQEMGVPVEEIVGATELESLGMDSLMTLTVLANLRETTGLDLAPDFFVENTSIDAIAETLYPKSKPLMMMPAAIDRAIRDEMMAEKATDSPPAVSLLLQGNPKTAKKTLFLFPDGSGSATSYATISKISPDVALYGLNCPFMKTPADFSCGIVGVSTLYKEEVRRRQPEGPYYLGGWSAGGIVAYEVALQLMQEGASIERLIFLDSPCPVDLEVIPPRLHHFFDEIGLLGTGTGTMPSWLLPHFESTLRALETYRPKVMDARKVPQILMVWAQDGVCGQPGDPQPPPQGDDPKSMTWLLQNRTDFGPNGWDALLGKEKMTFRTLKCNHFTLMREPAVHKLADLIRQGLE